MMFAMMYPASPLLKYAVLNVVPRNPEKFIIVATLTNDINARIPNTQNSLSSPLTATYISKRIRPIASVTSFILRLNTDIAVRKNPAISTSSALLKFLK